MGFVSSDSESCFFTSKEVAKGLGISLRTLQNYRNDGRIRFHKFSTRKIVYSKQHIWAFLLTTHCSFHMKERARKLLAECAVKYDKPADTPLDPV